MTSYIVASPSKKNRQEYITDFCIKSEIDLLDITNIDNESSTNLSSIGISEIKTLRAKIFLKPFKSKIKAIVIEDAQLLTIEAQNALLKVLEEPPDNTIIILSTDTIETLLPTIQSRCQIVVIPNSDLALTNKEEIEYIEFLEKLPNMKIGEKLKKAEELARDKDEAINWIGKFIFLLRDKLLKLDATDTNQIHNIKSFQKLHTILKTTNTNPRFAIETTLLSL